LCGKAFKGSFGEVMKKLRGHRKQAHPSAHKRSVKKSMKHRKLDPLKTRTRMISKPKVVSFKDIKADGLVRVLFRVGNDRFPEFALYPKKTKFSMEMKAALHNAGLTEEAKGKWVVRTNKFNIFVYV
jgi:hypothetical protein